jgi:hypothetical protein
MKLLLMVADFEMLTVRERDLVLEKTPGVPLKLWVSGKF